MSSQLSLIYVLPTNLTCPIAALKHSPSKRTKSVKSKPTSQPSSQAAAGGSGSSGQDCSAPPSKEGKTYVYIITLVTLSIAIRHASESWVQVRSLTDCRRDLRDGKRFSWVHRVRGPGLPRPAPPVCLARCTPWQAGGRAASEGSSTPCTPSLPASPSWWLLLYL